MSNLDTRLRETLDRVAESTKVNRRVEEIVTARRRRPTAKLVAAVAAFASVVAIFVFPMLLSRTPDGDVAGGVAPPAEPDWIIDPRWLTVDDDDLAVFDALTDAAAEVHGPDWRTSLRTEAVWCLHEGGPGADTRASDFPIEEELTVEALTVECATGNDSARNLDAPPETLTVCRGVFAKTEYQEWLSSDEYSVIAGDIDGTHPGFPVVLGWQSDCVSEEVDTTNKVVLSDDLDLDQINHARQLEMAVTGASHNDCFDYEQASALADEAVRSLATTWLRVEFTAVDQNLVEYCYQPVIDLQLGAVYVMGVDQPVAEELGTSTTLPPG
ncbi:MAG TPA: hypothetical protein VMS99_06865 [Acidimicrobiia bacterium]|nr:hypothetical protein [Acidimicrobiia bacterium]